MALEKYQKVVSSKVKNDVEEPIQMLFKFLYEERSTLTRFIKESIDLGFSRRLHRFINDKNNKTMDEI